MCGVHAGDGLAADKVMAMGIRDGEGIAALTVAGMEQPLKSIHIAGSVPSNVSVNGTPVLIFEKGEWRRKRMMHHCIQEADVMAAARAQDLEGEDQIKYAVIERKGDISIVKA